MPIIDSNRSGLRPLPQLADKLPVTFTGLPILKTSRDSVQGLTIDDNSDRTPNWDGQCIVRQFGICAVARGAVASTQIIGNVHHINRVPITISASRHARPVDVLPLSPVLAGSASDVKDKNFMAAISAVNNLFSMGTEPKLNATVGSYIRRVATSAPDLTRFNFRLAQLWWYTSLCELRSMQPDLGIPIAPLEHMASLTPINGALASINHGDHWLMVDANVLHGDVQMTCKVLALAATSHAFGRQNVYIPSVVGTPVQLPDIRIGYCGPEAFQHTNQVPSSHDVWAGAVGWASQVGCCDLFMECVEAISSLLYSVEQNRDSVFSSSHLTLELPPHDSRHYALFPLSLACNTLVDSDPPDEADAYTFACSGVVHAQLLNAAFKEAMWALGLGANEPSLRWTRASASWRRKLLSRTGGHPIPILGVMVDVLGKLGVNVGISSVLGSAAPHPTYRSDDALFHAARNSASWAELLDLLPAVPDAAVKAWTTPVSTSKVVQPFVRYHLDNITTAKLPSTAAMLLAVGAKVEELTKKEGDLNWSVSRLKIEKDRNGLVDTHPFKNTRADKWAQYKVVVTFPDYESALAAHHYADTRKDWVYYLVGNSTDDGGGVVGQDDFSPPAASTIDDFPDVGSSGNDRGTFSNATKPDPPDVPPPSLPSSGPVIDEPPPLARPHIPASASVSGLSKQQAAWRDVVMKHASPGVLTSVADLWSQYVNNSLELPTGKTKLEHFSPLINSLGTQLSELSIGKCVAAAPPRQRQGLATIIGKMCSQLMPGTVSFRTQEYLLRTSIRSNNVATAMSINPAVTLAELQEDNVYAAKTGETISQIGHNLLEAGLALTDFCVPKKKGCEYYNSVDGDLDRGIVLEKAGWKPCQDQSRARRGETIYYRPLKTPVPKDTTDVIHKAIIRVANEVEKAVEDQLRTLAAEAGSTTLPVPADTDKLHSDALSADVVDTEGNVAKLDIQPVPDSWEEREDFLVAEPPAIGGLQLPSAAPEPTEDIADAEEDVPFPVSSDEPTQQMLASGSELPSVLSQAEVDNLLSLPLFGDGGA